MNVRRVARWLLWLVLVPAVLVWALRAFVGSVYYVDSHSMEPTLHGALSGGDWVLVAYDDRPRLWRFDVVVLRRDHERAPLVKRVAGLPGEELQISGGDLFVNGRRLPPDAPRPPWIPIFDSALHDLSEQFHFDRDRWTPHADGYHVESRGSNATMAKLRTKCMDDYLLPDGTRAEGKRFVNDLALEIEFRGLTAGARLVLRLTEEGDAFSVELAAKNSTDAKLTLARTARTFEGDAPPEKLAVVDVQLDPAREWHTLRLSNQDNELRARLDGERGILTHVYTNNSPSLRPAEGGGFVHTLPRVEFGGAELDLDLRRVLVERDRTYFEVGPNATTAPLTLGPDQIFVLGDNSGESVDSREWGPVELDDVIGVPKAIVWPPERARRGGFQALPAD